MKIIFVVLNKVLFIALPLLAQASAPLWVQDAWRSMNYPIDEWYIGFSQDNAPASSAAAADALKALERNAQARMVESIVSHVSSRSTSSTASQQRRQGREFTETIDESYMRTIQVSATANIAGAQLFSYHDTKAKKIYAMAAVRRSDLIAYYVSLIELPLQRIENAVSEARQFTALGRKSDALNKLAESRRSLDECEQCSQYMNLLSAVDPGGASSRLLAREAVLRKKISAAVAETEAAKMAMSFYVDGSETIEAASVNIVISRLKSAVAASGYRTTGSRAEANYQIRVEVRACNTSTSAQNNSFCYACVRAEVINLETNKSEGRVDFTGPKVGWRNMETACGRAFERVVDDLWSRINQDVKIFK
jgi:hypothetical protein